MSPPQFPTTCSVGDDVMWKRGPPFKVGEITIKRFGTYLKNCYSCSRENCYQVTLKKKKKIMINTVKSCFESNLV